MLTNLKLRYLFIGVINAIFGYVTGVAVYLALQKIIHVVLIATFVNVITITFSFITYKIFVFKTKYNWLKEYLKSYIVYGSSALMSIVILWLLIDKVNMNIYVAQAATISITVAVSYFGHRYFTFKK